MVHAWRARRVSVSAPLFGDRSPRVRRLTADGFYRDLSKRPRYPSGDQLIPSRQNGANRVDGPTLAHMQHGAQMNTTTLRSFLQAVLMMLGAATLVVSGCAANVGAEDEGVNEAEVRHCSTRRHPVCGTNGITYSNACRAGSHHIAYEGACSAECQGLLCGAGETCDPGAQCPAMTTGERHPCDPIAPSCVPVEPPNPCASTTCATGTTCTVENGAALCLSLCATVRCTATTTCTVHGNSASCDPNACPPNNRACLAGHHYDGTPGVCACVADACPPNTRLCIRGTHYDNTPGVCACVADACPVNTRLCIRGTHYDGTPGVCACVADPQCTTDSDCHLEDNYCGGCACNALPTGQHAASCTNPVMCFREPCGGMTAACVSGSCIAR